MDQKEVLKKIGQLQATDLLPQNVENWEQTELFLKEVVRILLAYIKEENDRSSKVLEFHHPGEMATLCDLRIPEKPQNLEDLLKSCEAVLKLGVKTGHPRFFNQISTGLDLVSMAGEWLTATANTNMFTYEISPVFILMEKEVTRKMIELIGWGEGQGDAIFAPGGAIANLYAMNAARHAKFPRVKPLGMTDMPSLCCFTSEDSHYSIKGAAAVTGVGTDMCFNIPTDSKGRMIPEALEMEVVKRKKMGLHPFFVSATAGTTVYGAWDPLHQIADICERHNLWFHIDQDKPYDVSYDTGDKAMQCGRHNDIFKLWLMWRSKGMEGYRAQINRLMDLTAYFTARIRQTEGYELVVDPPEFLNICFWYVPPSLRHLDTAEKNARLEKIAPKIKAKMMERGTTMVGYQPDKQRPNFFRMIISNQAITRKDLDFLIKEIVDIGHSL
uniref:Glutamate decarboxylase 1 n=1 Tax=Steinernema glaseri TaxID=37863 RepID=A0A1I7ZXJ5_9BILA